jgi:hypothetical protein
LLPPGGARGARGADIDAPVGAGRGGDGGGGGGGGGRGATRLHRPQTLRRLNRGGHRGLCGR